jgi:predicted  nucleic acid-binding Zn-ribbon protein
MPDENELYRDLHHILTLRADIESQLRRGPMTIKASENNAVQAEEAVKASRKAIQQKTMAADEKQLQLSEREEKLKKYDANLNEAKSNREYQALKEQIAADNQANSVLSDEILEILEAIEVDQQAQTGLIDSHAKLVGDAATIKERILQRRETLIAELADVEARLVEAEKKIEGDIKKHYRRMVDAAREDALAAIEGQSCGGCYKTLSPQSIDRLRMGSVFVCTSCSRILYTA